MFWREFTAENAEVAQSRFQSDSLRIVSFPLHFHLFSAIALNQLRPLPTTNYRETEMGLKYVRHSQTESNLQYSRTPKISRLHYHRHRDARSRDWRNDRNLQRCVCGVRANAIPKPGSTRHGVVQTRWQPKLNIRHRLSRLEAAKHFIQSTERMGRQFLQRGNKRET